MPYPSVMLGSLLEAYLSAILTTNLLTLAVFLHLLIVYLVTTLKDRVDDLLARDVLYLTA
jgi:hypothetical protein